MLESLNISNYRCFDKFEATGFEQVNLIGGKNNVGKSCLLEAILTALYQGSLNELKQIRKEDSLDFFYNNAINISSSKIEYKWNNELFDRRLDLNHYDNTRRNLINDRINYVSAKITFPAISPIASFDEIQINKLDFEFAKVLKLVDERIENLRSYRTKGDILFVQSKNNNDLPIQNFGDAINNILHYFTPIFEKKAKKINHISLLLIDEIENGLHYTAHVSFWEKLFDLSKSQNVQVFATTHSLEMIKAFNEVSTAKKVGAYFEMAREFDSNQMFIQKHDIELLQYELENAGSTFRGE